MARKSILRGHFFLKVYSWSSLTGKAKEGLLIIYSELSLKQSNLGKQKVVA